MSELFSSTPPTEPGWYYIKSFGNEEPDIFEIFLSGDGRLTLLAHRWSDPTGDFVKLDDAKEYLNGRAQILFGPKIPSPEDLATFTPSIGVDITSIRSTTPWMEQREYEAEMKRLIEPEATNKNGLINE